MPLRTTRIAALLITGACASATAEAPGLTPVPGCEAFLKALAACPSINFPDAGPSGSAAALAQMRNDWNMAARTAEGRAILGRQCRQMEQEAKEADEPFSCDF